MDDTDDHRSRSPSNSLFESSRSAFRSQHSFNKGLSSVEDDHEALIKQAMEQAEKYPDRHRMAVVSTQSRKKINLVDVKNLTISKKRLVLSRAMGTSGQDNERLLNKIRERQDRYCLRRRGRLWLRSQCTHADSPFIQCKIFAVQSPDPVVNFQTCSMARSIITLDLAFTDSWQNFCATG